MTTAKAHLPRQTAFLLAGLCALTLVSLAPEVAAAQGRMEARYEASLSGIPVGKGTWNIEIGDDTFSASAQGATAGLLKAFAGGSGSGGSQGRVVNGALVATSYTASISSKKSETIRMILANGNVKDFAIDPEPPVDPDRIPVTEAHKRGVLDPMTSTMLRVPGNGELLVAGNLPHRLRRVRRPAALRSEARLQAHGEREGREGLSRPGAGLRASISRRSRAISRIGPSSNISQAERRMEISFVPIAGTRILVPFRTTIPTPFGPAVLEATTFNTVATPPRVAKTQ